MHNLTGLLPGKGDSVEIRYIYSKIMNNNYWEHVTGTVVKRIGGEIAFLPDNDKHHMNCHFHGFPKRDDYEMYRVSCMDICRWWKNLN